MKTRIEIEVEVEYLYHPELPPLLSARPEDCYEGTPESIEITSVVYQGTEIQDTLDMKQIDEIEEACLEDVKRRMQP